MILVLKMTKKYHIGKPSFVKKKKIFCETFPYDNDVSDNCDNNFGTFDDFGVKMTKKYHIT